nr:3,4-dihydroxy-2-butanone 4-phosphate synthase [Chlamydiota bacterium]
MKNNLEFYHFIWYFNALMSNINLAIKALKNGNFIIVSDDIDRENEGDLVIAAEMTRPEHVAFMLKHTGGVICVPMLPERLRELSLPLMVTENTDPNRTAFTVSVDSREGV